MRHALKRSELDQLAMSWVWRGHGRGLNTSVGIHTRELLRRAFSAGFRKCERLKRKRA